MKNYLIFTILIIIFISLHYVDAINKLNIESVKSNKDLARTRRRPFGFFNPLMGYGFGLHALAIIYWLKVKAVIIAFIVGTAIVWGSKYFWPNKACPKQIETSHEGAIIPFEHGPIWSSHNHYNDHFPYSSSLSFSDHDHDPYSAYSSSSYSDHSPPSGPDATEQYLDHNPHDKKWKRKSRSVRQQEQQFENENTEDQISELMFLFLGVGSTECRKRFLCEWEYQAQQHPLTRMAFRIFGRGVFKKYARDPKDENSAKSFRDCARVHNQCTVIEENLYDYTQSQSNNNESENHINNVQELTANDPIAKTIFSRPLKRNKKKTNNLINANFDFQKNK